MPSRGVLFSGGTRVPGTLEADSMVGWLYIGETLAAPIRVLELDALTGLITIEVMSKLVPNRAELRGHTVVEFKGWERRRIVRCLGAEEVGGSLMIEAIDLGLVGPDDEDDNAQTRGTAEDWLVIDGQARCKVQGFKQGNCPGSLTSHCLFHVPLEDWRDMRIGEGAPLAGVGVCYDEADGSDGSITPLLHTTREAKCIEQPLVEIVRLRERERFRIAPLATDWGESTTLVISRVIEAGTLIGGKQVSPAMI